MFGIHEGAERQKTRLDQDRDAGTVRVQRQKLRSYLSAENDRIGSKRKRKHEREKQKSHYQILLRLLHRCRYFRYLTLCCTNIITHCHSADPICIKLMIPPDILTN